MNNKAFFAIAIILLLTISFFAGRDDDRPPAVPERAEPVPAVEPAVPADSPVSVDAGLKLPFQPRSIPAALTINRQTDVTFTLQVPGARDSTLAEVQLLANERELAILRNGGADGDLLANDDFFAVTTSVDTQGMEAGECLSIVARVPTGNGFSDSPPYDLCTTSFAAPFATTDTSAENLITLQVGEDSYLVLADEVLLKINDGVSDNRIRSIAEEVNAELVGTNIAYRLYQLRFENRFSPAELAPLLDRLKGLDEVEFSAPNLIVTGAIAYDPDAPMPNGDRCYTDSSEPECISGDTIGQAGLQRINARQAWQNLPAGIVPGQGLVIAFVDSGLDFSHPDLSGKSPTSGTDYVNGGAPDDGHGHGTRVAGIAAAQTDNFAGIAGAGWDAGIHVIRVTNDSNTFGDIANLSVAIDEAGASAATIINLSLQAPNFAALIPDICNAVNNAIMNMGTLAKLAVAAAGNTKGSTYYPGACNTRAEIADEAGIITVASTKRDVDQTAAYSSGETYADVAAPGVDILSTNLGGGYVRGAATTGTSFATPFVAGAAAVLLSKPGVTVGDVEPALESTGATVERTDSAGVPVTPAANETFNRIDLLAALLSFNDPPVNTVPGAQAVDEDTDLDLGTAGISVSDANGNLVSTQVSVGNGTLSVTPMGVGPANVSPSTNSGPSLTVSGSEADINATLGTLVYRGNADFNGADTLDVVSLDSEGDNDTDTVSITIAPVDDGVADTFSTVRDTPFSDDVSSNDLHSGPATYGSAAGTVAMNPDGSFTYTPPPGFTGIDSFNYSVTDASDTEVVPVTVTVVEPDNCPGIDNPDQADFDNDGIGNACDSDIDSSLNAPNGNSADACPGSADDSDCNIAMCFPQFTGTPDNPSPPVIDGSVNYKPDSSATELIDSGWKGASLYTFDNGTDLHDVAFQALRDGSHLYFAFEVFNDTSFNDDDLLVLTLRPDDTLRNAPDSSPTYPDTGVNNDIRIFVYPVCSSGADGNGGGCNPPSAGDTDADEPTLSSIKRDASPRLVRAWKNSVNNWAAPEVSFAASVIDAKVRSHVDGSRNFWSIELKLPIAAVAASSASETDWPGIDDDFLMYFNVIDVDSTAALSTARQSMWPGMGIKQFHAIYGNVEDFAYPHYEWGRASRTDMSLCSGVRIDRSGIGTRTSADDPAVLENTQDGAIIYGTPPNDKVNRFYAEVTNTGPPANNVTARFRIADWGYNGGWVDANWRDIPANTHPANPTPNPTAPATVNASQEFTLDWIVADGETSRYTDPLTGSPTSNPLHQCVLVELDSTSNVNFVKKSEYRNMNFSAVASEFNDAASLSARGYGAPPRGMARHEFLLKIDARKIDRKTVDGERRLADLDRTPSKEQEKECNVLSRLRWSSTGYHNSGRDLVINGNRYDVITPTGGFGHYITHRGCAPVERWEMEFDGMRGVRLDDLGRGLYKVSLAQDEVIKVRTRIVPVEECSGGDCLHEFVVKYLCQIVIVLLLLVILYLLWLLRRKSRLLASASS